ncbi:MAG: hypothetical protein P1V18_04425 [Candidatus Gracilibacteria bacterium]|nr:hypothetical protein [Candidatus Gracilibacteria bacterium]
MKWTRLVTLVLCVVLFVVGGYVGFLGALVDMEELSFLQEVAARTDLEQLQRQLARSKSIADARRRAYIKRKDNFIVDQKQLRLQLETQKMREELLVDQGQSEELVSVQVEIKEIENRLKEIELQGQQSLNEEEQDLKFFDDQVKVVEQLVQRQELEEKFEQDASTLFSVSSRLEDEGVRNQLIAQESILRQRWQRLRTLLDQQKKLLEDRKKAKEIYTYWEKNPQNPSGDILITVNDKSGSGRQLNPQHASQIATGLSIMPGDFDQRIQRVYVVYGDSKMRRGMSGVGVVFMKGEELDFFRVLVHEFGHIWDLHREVSVGPKSQFFDGSYRLLEEDPSVEFYKYSWESNFEHVDDRNAFASGYGLSDPFEDFAEIFALYVLQGRTFEQWQREHPVLADKYRFMKEVYANKVFPSSGNYSTRPYDVTMMSVDYEELLE